LKTEKFVHVLLENPPRKLSKDIFSVCSIYFRGGFPIDLDLYKAEIERLKTEVDSVRGAQLLEVNENA